MKPSFPGAGVARLLAVTLAAILVATGCSDSTAPENNNGGGGGQQYTDVPDIPEPSTPGGETGAHSDTVTVIGPLTTHYRPMVKSARASWGIQTRCCSRPWLMWICDPWIALVGMPPTWSDQLPELNLSSCFGYTFPAALARPNPWKRMLLLQDGNILTPESEGPEEMSWWMGISSRAECRLSWRTSPLEKEPFIRRDRFWVRKQLEGGAGNFLILIGDTQGEISTTYTSGSSITETETFGRSVTASAGLSLDALSLGVSVTLSYSFSTSLEVHEEKSESFTKTVFGEDGKTVHFQVWELVEYYTITDANGAPYTDPNYDFELSDFHIRGVAVALVATKFNS